MDKRADEWISRQMNGLLDNWVDGWITGKSSRWMNGLPDK